MVTAELAPPMQPNYSASLDAYLKQLRDCGGGPRYVRRPAAGRRISYRFFDTAAWIDMDEGQPRLTAVIPLQRWRVIKSVFQITEDRRMPNKIVQDEFLEEVRIRALTRGQLREAIGLDQEFYASPRVRLRLERELVHGKLVHGKAAVEPGTTADSNWAEHCLTRQRCKRGFTSSISRGRAAGFDFAVSNGATVIRPRRPSTVRSRTPSSDGQRDHGWRIRAEAADVLRLRRHGAATAESGLHDRSHE